jgi:hypothetical protein
MDAFFHFMGVLLECVTALILLTALLIAIVYRLPDGSRPKEILRAITRRVGATTAVALIGIPLQPIPEVDGLYDITGVVILVIYWYGLIGRIRAIRNVSDARPHISEAARALGQLAGHVKNLRQK